MKPSKMEEEYITRMEYEKKRKLEEEKHKRLAEGEKKRLKELHYISSAGSCLLSFYNKE